MTGADAWSDAVAALQLFALDPVGSAGVLLRSRPGPVRDRWLAMLRSALPSSFPHKHLPLHITDGRLLGGLDLNATLRAGRPVAERGILAEADGGILVLAMAERLPSTTTSHIIAAMDAGETCVEREGISLRTPTRFGVVALDEGLEDEFAPASLRDRLSFHVDLNGISAGDAEEIIPDADEITSLRERRERPQADADQIEALCTAAAALGIFSLRAPLLAIRVACNSASLAGHATVEQDDVAMAARLVLAPRALIFPQVQEPDPSDRQPEPPPETETADDGREDLAPDMDRALDEVILAAAKAAIPADVLAAMSAGSMGRRSPRASGKAGALQKSNTRGRPNGVLRGELRSGAKLSVIETLRAAAPWQPIRRREAADGSVRPRIFVRKDDFRIVRFKQRSETTTIFVVDASGSAALHRLAEAKGAVELLLADCYIRRDQVALIAFRGIAAELLLPPTRSLARAKRSLAGLPGGGGTPLAAGLDAAFALADLIRRKGQTPTVIVLTDGRANIARDGSQGRPRAEQDAMGAAKQFRAAGIAAVLVDTSPRPGALAGQFAKEMGGRYLPLPHADASTLSRAVKAHTG